MDLEDSVNLPIINNKDNNKVSLGFITMEGKLIYLNEYPLNTPLNEVIDNFIQKNKESTLKPYFNFWNNYDIKYLSFYFKKDDGFKKIEYSRNKKAIISLKIEDLKDTNNFLSPKYSDSSSISAMNNLNYLKIYVKYEKKFQYLVEKFDEYISNTTYLIGKPQLNKKKFYLYNKYLKELRLISCMATDINKTKINDFTFLDVYCNAKNFLYIYEGISNDSVEFSRFFNINLAKNKLSLISKIFPKRILLSMIYIPSSYIFIIGGKNTKEVLIYEIKDRNTLYEIYPHQLPKELLEPSLISINNKFIYILENSTVTLNIFRVNLLTISPFEQIEIKNDNNLVMNQKFFGVVKNKNSILFLGGQMLNMSSDNKSEGKYCFEFHYDSNKIVRSKREFSQSDFIEKTFLPIGDELYIQFAEYKKDNKNELKMVQYNGKEQVVEKNGMESD